ncbi:MAG TPA: hypothetical protein VG321_00930, partial [Solirubrobacteraceae bacterium]|nr:hypothetical protein [Solirubrobacteraceae bacterium]
FCGTRSRSSRPQHAAPACIDAPAFTEQMLVRRRYPHRGRSREKRRSSARSAASSPATTLTSVRRPRLSDIPARPPLRDTETILDHDELV